MLVLWIILGIWGGINLIIGIISVIDTLIDPFADDIEQLFPIQFFIIERLYNFSPITNILVAIILYIFFLPFTIFWVVLYFIIGSLLWFFGAFDNY